MFKPRYKEKMKGNMLKTSWRINFIYTSKTHTGPLFIYEMQDRIKIALTLLYACSNLSQATVLLKLCFKVFHLHGNETGR
jgi:hypothetical protein